MNKNQKAIECRNCHLWSHASCNGISKSEYSKLIEEDDEVPWFCIPCLILANAEIFPFGFLSKTELCDLLGVDLPSQIEQLPSFEVQSKLINMPNLNSFDLDENVVQMINSKYYKVQDLPKAVTQTQNFSLFRVNIRSLTKHYDELHSLLYSTKIPFDIIGITETKQSFGKEFLLNVNIDKYQLHSQPTKSACGGAAIYVKKSLDHKVLHEFNALEDEFESLWVEITTGPRSKNVLCCSSRHPDTDVTKFIEYLESVLSKVDKNKIVCVMGDFNINLLNYESHNDTNEFINSMVSHHMIPQILQPRRVTDHSSTVIDNIYTNATNFEIISGNILNQIADHFSQFLLLRKMNANYKNSAYHQYDYSNFNKDNFLADFSKIDWSDNDNIGVTDVNKNFSTFKTKYLNVFENMCL